LPTDHAFEGRDLGLVALKQISRLRVVIDVPASNFRTQIRIFGAMALPKANAAAQAPDSWPAFPAAETSSANQGR
jgi:hypothetical protein